MSRTISALSLVVAAGLALGLAGCDNMNGQQQRTLSGAGIGAGAGAVLGAVTVGDPLAGAAVGGAAGAAIGATTR